MSLEEKMRRAMIAAGHDPDDVARRAAEVDLDALTKLDGPTQKNVSPNPDPVDEGGPARYREAGEPAQGSEQGGPSTATPSSFANAPGWLAAELAADTEPVEFVEGTLEDEASE